jgi:hypothetical protein
VTLKPFGSMSPLIKIRLCSTFTFPFFFNMKFIAKRARLSP